MKGLLSERVVVLDRAWGTMLQGAGLTPADNREDRLLDHPREVTGDPDLLNLTRPDVVLDVHRHYLTAGADITTTNTFTATNIGQADYGLQSLVREMNLEGARLARQAADDVGGRFVAGSVGPLNVTLSLSPRVEDPAYRAVLFAQVHDTYAEQIQALAEGDDILIEAGEFLRLPMLRQQTVKPEGRPNRCLADYVARTDDHIGGFAVAVHGADNLAAKYEAGDDDYRAIMVKALADRLAEAFAEWAHLEARRAWFEPDADPAIEDLHAERFRGIRPAFGYPASPDHSQKRTLFDLLDAERVGMRLTESYAMTPAASVSGLLFAHPASRYFTVGRVGQDQIEDYARRRNLDRSTVERWLRPNLAYQPE